MRLDGLAGQMTPRRAEKMWAKYALRPEDYMALLILQDGRCAICGVAAEPRPDGRAALDVDHDHKTNAVRGLVCRRCNLLVAYAEALAELTAEHREKVEAWAQESLAWTERNMLRNRTQHRPTVAQHAGGPYRAHPRRYAPSPRLRENRRTHRWLI